MKKLAALLASAALLAGGASAGSAAHEHAYPQTRPSAGQFCKKIHRGIVTKAKNGRLVRCTAEGPSRSRWKYVR
jgi:hypothetical protein